MNFSTTACALFVLSTLILPSGILFADSVPSLPSLPKDALPLPLISQATSYSCGAASLLSVLYYWKAYDGNETKLFKPLETTSKWGTEPSSIARVANRIGLHAEMRQGLTIADLRDYLRQGATVILDIQAWQDPPNGKPRKAWKDEWDAGHYVVLSALDSTYAYFMDPSAHVGYGYMPLSELLPRWHDLEDRHGPVEKFYQLGIIITGKSPHTAFPSALVRMD